MKKIILLFLIPIQILGSPRLLDDSWLEKSYPDRDKYFAGYATGNDFSRTKNQAIANLYSQIVGEKISRITDVNWVIEDGISHDNTSEVTKISLPNLISLTGIQVEYHQKGCDYQVLAFISKEDAILQVIQNMCNYLELAENKWRQWQQNSTISYTDTEILDSCLNGIDKILNISNPDIFNNLHLDKELLDSLRIFSNSIHATKCFEKVRVNLSRDASFPVDLFDRFKALVSTIPGVELSSVEYSKLIRCTIDTSNLIAAVFEDLKGGNLILEIDPDYLDHYQWLIQALLLFQDKLDNNLFDLIGTLANSNQKEYLVYTRNSIKPKYKDNVLFDLEYNLKNVFDHNLMGGLETLYKECQLKKKTKDQRNLEKSRIKYRNTISYQFGEIVLDFTLLCQKSKQLSKDQYIRNLIDINERLNRVNIKIQNTGLSNDELMAWSTTDNFLRYFLILNKLVSDQMFINHELTNIYETITIYNDIELAVKDFAKLIVEYHMPKFYVFAEDMDSLGGLFNQYYNDLESNANYFFTTGSLNEALYYSCKCIFLFPKKSELSVRINSMVTVDLRDNEPAPNDPSYATELIPQDSLLIRRFGMFANVQGQGSDIIEKNIQKVNEHEYLLQLEISMPSTLYIQYGIVDSDEISYTVRILLKNMIDFLSYCTYALNYKVRTDINIIGKADKKGFKKRPKYLVRADGMVFIMELGQSYLYTDLKKSDEDFFLNAALAFSRGKIIEGDFEEGLEPFLDLFNVNFSTNSCSVSEFIGPIYRSPALTFSFYLEPQTSNENPIVQENSPKEKEIVKKMSFFKDFWKIHKNQSE